MYFRSIAFGGGGVRGGLHVGAISAIEKMRGNLVFPEGVYGSSIGSIVATAVAFGLQSNQIRSIFDKHLQLSAFLPSLRLQSIQQFPDKKGLFSMDMVEQSVVRMFQEHGVDLQGKKCSDAPQKLFIVASNLTTGRPTFLTGNVSVLDAIRCSCCLPFVFQPQVVYNQVYVDGGVHVNCLDRIVPKDCLVVHISQANKPVRPEEIADMTLLSYVGSVYGNSRKDKVLPNTLWLRNDTVHILQELTAKDKEALFEEGYSQTLAFLSKLIPEKLE